MSCKNGRRRKSLFPKIFCAKQKKKSTRDDCHLDSAEFGEVPVPSPPPSPLLMKTHSGPEPGRPNRSEFTSAGPSNSGTQGFRIFVATWNVGGKPPHSGLNLNDFLPADDQSDIYVLGFQEIVPLNAGNVLVIEDSEPAVKWLRLIDRALNRPMPINAYACPYTHRTYNKPSSSTTATTSKASRDSKNSTSIFFQKPSLKTVSKTFRTEPKRRLKTCNCSSEMSRKYYRDSCFICPQAYINADDSSEEEEEEDPCNLVMTDATPSISTASNRLRYSLIASKQMVGIFVTVWAKREHAQHVGHLRISTVGCGILGCLGNKGCISVSMSLHQTTFCFVCSHLASGQKEGDELRRNADVIEILKNTQFPRICRSPTRRFPENILGHDRVIWLGDLNYRIALSYTETRKLLDADDWDALLNKDQLKIERESGRVFKGWNEGKIYFAPTYKYSNDSDDYAGEIATKKKRRTPSWCDRILWHGGGIVQLSYVRGESRFSDHRPVCAVFVVEVGMLDGRLKSALSGPNMKVGVEELLPRSNGYMTV